MVQLLFTLPVQSLLQDSTSNIEACTCSACSVPDVLNVSARLNSCRAPIIQLARKALLTISEPSLPRQSARIEQWAQADSTSRSESAG